MLLTICNPVIKIFTGRCSASIYEDAEEFLNICPVPVYFVTNSDDRYILEELKRYSLNPAGIITSEEAKYSKPRNEIFLYALQKTGLQSWEVLHIGDSLESDVKCPASVGIRSIWLNRDGKTVPEGVESVKNLLDIKKYL